MIRCRLDVLSFDLMITDNLLLLLLFIIIIIITIIIIIISIIIIIIIIVIVIVTIIIVIFRINWDWKDTGKCSLLLRVRTAPRQLISNRSED